MNKNFRTILLIASIVCCLSSCKKESYVWNMEFTVYDYDIMANGYSIKKSDAVSSSSGNVSYSVVDKSSSVSTQNVHAGDRLLLYYVHVGSRIDSPTVTVYAKLFDTTIAFERKANYQVSVPIKNGSGEPTQYTRSCAVAYIKEFKIPDVEPGRYMVTYSATDGDGDLVLDKGVGYITITAN